MPRHADYSNVMRRTAGYLLLALIFIGFIDSTTKRLWYLPSLLYLVGMSAGLLRRRNSTIESVTAPPHGSMDKSDSVT